MGTFQRQRKRKAKKWQSPFPRKERLRQLKLADANEVAKYKK